jgi:hypothetical protein
LEKLCSQLPSPLQSTFQSIAPAAVPETLRLICEVNGAFPTFGTGDTLNIRVGVAVRVGVLVDVAVGATTLTVATPSTVKFCRQTRTRGTFWPAVV